MQCYRGVVIDPRQYDEYAKFLHNKNVVRIPKDLVNPKTGKEFSAEDIAFSLYSELNVVVESGSRDLLLPFIECGWLLDVRKRKFINFHDFEKYVAHEIMSKQKRIEHCNSLRRVLLRDCRLAFRCCGPEFETLMSPSLASRATEHVGLFDDGTYITFEGTEKYYKYKLKNDEVIKAFVRVDLDPELDDGQRKLYSLMYGFAHNRDIVYIGCSPGIGWAKALRDLNYEHTLYGFDPRPLSERVTDICGDKVRFYESAITSPDDVINHIPGSTKFDLVWDVRGDWVNDDQYDIMVRGEIQLLARCLEAWSVRCARCVIKFAPRWGEEYLLPDGGRFFRMPYCQEREVHELRYVCRASSLKGLSAAACDVLRRRANQTREEDEPMQAFHNAMLLRLDVGNYMRIAPFEDSACDINLFTINRNTITEMRTYLNSERPKVVSYFTKLHLERDEHELREEIVLDLNKHSVCDSRPFIHAKIEGLYLIVDKTVSMYRDEYRFSETYLVKGVYHEIVKNIGAYEYDKAKRKGAMNEGSMYARPPMSFSLAENLSSPSGHMMRIMFEYERGRASLFMFMDKMISNHYYSVTGRSRTNAICSLVETEERGVAKERSVMFSQLCKRYGVIELESRYLWHSASELIAGMAGFAELCRNGESRDYSRLIEQLRKIITSKRLGSEVFKFESLMQCGKRLKGYRDVRKGFPNLPRSATPSDVLEFMWGRASEVDDNHPHLLSRLVSFADCGAFEYALIAQLHLDYDARGHLFMIGAMLCLDKGIEPAALGAWRSASIILALNGIRRATSDDEKEMWSQRLREQESRLTRYRMQYDEMSRDLDSTKVRIVVVRMMAKSWLLKHPEWEVYAPRCDKDWLRMESLKTGEDAERVFAAYERICAQTMSVTKEELEHRVRELVPGAVMRTP